MYSKETSFAVSLAITLTFEEDEGRKQPFEGFFAVSGLYEHKPGLPKGLVDYFVKINGPIMLWPYMRELVASVTSRAGYPPLMLETIDVARLTGSSPQAVDEPS